MPATSTTEPGILPELGPTSTAALVYWRRPAFLQTLHSCREWSITMLHTNTRRRTHLAADVVLHPAANGRAALERTGPCTTCPRYNLSNYRHSLVASVRTLARPHHRLP